MFKLIELKLKLAYNLTLSVYKYSAKKLWKHLEKEKNWSKGYLSLLQFCIFIVIIF